MYYFFFEYIIYVLFYNYKDMILAACNYKGNSHVLILRPLLFHILIIATAKCKFSNFLLFSCGYFTVFKF